MHKVIRMEIGAGRGERRIKANVDESTIPNGGTVLHR